MPHDGIVLSATRELLWIHDAADARTTALQLVADLGGTLTAHDTQDPGMLPIDLSFGVGDPVLPCAPVGSAAHIELSRCLPGFVRDANRAIELTARTQRLVQAVNIDALTGLPNRRVMGRALGRLQVGDVIIMLDLDHFKQLNDAHGHLEGDKVLSAFGEALTETMRVRDLASRYGGEEFLLLLSRPVDRDGIEAFLQRLTQRWSEVRPHPVTFSAGIAQVNAEHDDVVERADAAMYAAKRAGRNCWRWSDATEPSDELFADDADGASTEPSATAFVAHSLLRVPRPGRADLLDAFADRLGQVDHWPGFQRLEVWGDCADPTSFVMVSWWDNEAAFKAYMASDDHQDSHARIPAGESRPRPQRFTRYKVVAL